FVFFKDDFDRAELERLKPLILSAEYQATKGEAPYYRAYWIVNRSGGDHAQASQLLLAATWQGAARTTPATQPSSCGDCPTISRPRRRHRDGSSSSCRESCCGDWGGSKRRRNTCGAGRRSWDRPAPRV